jgi:hypothetical protein
MTTKQLDFIRSLVGERELPADDKGSYVARLLAGNAPEPDGKQSSAIIDWLLALPRKPEAVTDVPEGRYAVEVGGKLRFFKVDTPTEGKWAGRLFLNEVVGGNTSDGRGWPVKGAQRTEILGLLAEAPDFARSRYGREIGRCGFCHILLTDDLSRAVGIGPDCAEKHGIDRQALLASVGPIVHTTHPDGCDRCGKLADLFHNEASGLSLCEACDRITDEVEAALDERGFPTGY